ncbi:ATP-binding protein [Pseudonocardia sichuanensis]
MNGGRREVLATAAYGVLLVACALLSVAWLAAGAVVAVAAQLPGAADALAAAGAAGDRWAQGVLAALPAGGPAGQAVLDYGFSAVTLVIAAVLGTSQERSWSIRLLVLAMVGAAGAFNLQAHAASAVVETATGLPIGTLHQVLLHGVACAAYIVALLLFPPGRGAQPGGAARAVVVVAGTGTLLLVAVGTALLPHTTSCVLFFGILVPVAGLVVLPRRIRGAPTATARTQARLLFSVLAAAFAITAVLAVITLLLWSTGWRSVVLVDMTSHEGMPGHGEPTALLFWFSRLACIAVAVAVFVATRRGGLWTAERLFSRGLAVGLTSALVGGGYVVVRRTLDHVLEVGALTAAVVATAMAAPALLPVYVRAERLADRLLFGSRPTPYRVLAGITALSRVTATDAPDLTQVAEAVGRGLGAGTCRLTVTRPGLRDRSHTWTEGGEHGPGELVEVVVRHGGEAVGTLAVDHGAVAGLHHQRRHLLEDVADSLGVVLQASRSGIELERQLRAALAHAGEIAASRRAVVAEMDAERRRIERDLHDGAQHHLVSLRLTLGLVEHQVSTGQLDKARTRLEQLAGQIDVAESILAETAMGVSSPLLAERGLVRALEEELARGQPPIAVDADGVVPAGDGRFPHDVESAVYFCCLEAVGNARKHAPGASVVVRLRTEDGRLRFTVQDDGPGWDQAGTTGSPGRGLRNVTARISAVGGRVEVRSAPGRGTTLEGSLPLPEPAARPAPRPPASTGSPLLDQVRDAVREARELYPVGVQAGALRALAERLDDPRTGPRGHEPAERHACREDARTARAVLRALEELVRTDPPHAGAELLRYRLDRIRSGAHELAELDVLDALGAGELQLPDGERRAAERLLGVLGPETPTRLGLAPGSPAPDVRRAATEQLAQWQRHAVNPLAGSDARTAADVLVRTCERLLARP